MAGHAGIPGGMVLAGGAGRRLGGPKAALLLGGRSLVERAVGLLSQWCDPVVVVSRPEVALPPLTVAVVHDHPGGLGPLNAVATGLAHLATDDVVVLACDLPLAGPLVARLAAAPPGAAVVAAEGNRRQPLCARYPRRAALEACEGLLAAGEARMTALADELGAVVVPATGDELANLNTPAELDAVDAVAEATPGPGREAETPGRRPGP